MNSMRYAAFNHGFVIDLDRRSPYRGLRRRRPPGLLFTQAVVNFGAAPLDCDGAIIRDPDPGVAAPLLFLIDPALVPGSMIVAGLGVAFLVYGRDHAAVDHREIAWVLPGIVIGVAIAGIVLRLVSRDLLGLLFGVLVLVAVALSVRRPPTPGRHLLFWAGGLAGFMGTATSIGGPPLALAFQNRRGMRLRGTLAACFAPTGMLSLVALSWAGHLDVGQVLAGLSLLPGIALGVRVSTRAARHLDRHWLRAAVLVVSALAGIAAILRAVI
ncbi:MAG: sulfite exporter TauE/SafE family protein [Halofilum sp. (in: g-proteobacteria)]|nr:sulfite exporter TauE/SafE family protein [Halofilum sp. (in: g-proteobacteria)]